MATFFRNRLNLLGDVAQPGSDSYGGVICRGNKIETGALPEELEKVARALEQLINILRKLPEMAVLSG